MLWGLLAAAVAETAVPATRGVGYGLGLVEARLARDYGGRGIIHLKRLAASLLADDHLRVSGSALSTLLGTPVVVGGGYDAPAGNTLPGAVSIYGSGPLVLYKSEVDARSLIDRSVNNVEAVAQRDYVLGWDCAAVGVTVTL